MSSIGVIFSSARSAAEAATYAHARRSRRRRTTGQPAACRAEERSASSACPTAGLASVAPPRPNRYLRDRTKCVDLQQVNRVLMQPHWRLKPDPDWTCCVPILVVPDALLRPRHLPLPKPGGSPNGPPRRSLVRHYDPPEHLCYADNPAGPLRRISTAPTTPWVAFLTMALRTSRFFCTTPIRSPRTMAIRPSTALLSRVRESAEQPCVRARQSHSPVRQPRFASRVFVLLTDELHNTPAFRLRWRYR